MIESAFTFVCLHAHLNACKPNSAITVNIYLLEELQVVSINVNWGGKDRFSKYFE